MYVRKLTNQYHHQPSFSTQQLPTYLPTYLFPIALSPLSVLFRVLRYSISRAGRAHSYEIPRQIDDAFVYLTAVMPLTICPLTLHSHTHTPLHLSAHSLWNHSCSPSRNSSAPPPIITKLTRSMMEHCDLFLIPIPCDRG
ncbi:hypothetical protein B0H65DRAFT_458348 [Neurospora tetraspora]|uniref:Uncharacterized protein n=1 Tax=Neurospora tetraspora TaxID=94610 RepID=A0AAE0JKY6_9PEZI|nr:hypothetical protein B0H65DRAFT_458348 [Neurospora tetraspora]